MHSAISKEALRDQLPIPTTSHQVQKAIIQHFIIIRNYAIRI